MRGAAAALTVMGVRISVDDIQAWRRTTAGLRAILAGCGMLLVACVLSIAPCRPVSAQLVERNLPPQPPPRTSTIQIGSNDIFKSDDATPLGVNIRAIALIGAGVDVKPRSDAAGIEV
jgi:hemolysin activation/secretion protein